MQKLKLLFLTIATVSLATLAFTPVTIATDENPNIAQIDDISYSSLEDAIAAAEPNSTIDILSDITTTTLIDIDKPLTINGNHHQITATLSDTTHGVIEINTSDEVIIHDLNINTNARAIALIANVHHLTVTGSTMTVGVRGIHTASNDNHNSTITLEDCVIQKSGIVNYDEEVPGGDVRGISLWQYSDSTISLKNTTVQGFSYVINIAPENFASPNVNLIIDNSTLKGRAGLNIWTAGFNIDIKDSKFHGINNFSGSSESFANIVINRPNSSSTTIPPQATLNIVNTAFTNYQNEIGLPNPNALQHAFALRSSDNVVNISGNSSFVDATSKLDSPFSSTDTENTITITGGIYDYDVSAYVPEGYEVIAQDGRFVVSKTTPATPDDAEILLPAPSDETFSLQLDQSAADILKQSLISSGIFENHPNLTSADQITVTPELTHLDSDEVPAADQTEITSFIENSDLTFAQYFDLSVNVHINGENTDHLTNLTSPINFSIKLPADLLQPNRKFYIIRLHDGTTERIDTQLDGDTLTFASDKFSTYALAYTDNQPSISSDSSSTPTSSPTITTDSDTPDAPNTGFFANIMSSQASVITFSTILLVISTSAGYIAYRIHRRRTQNHD